MRLLPRRCLARGRHRHLLDNLDAEAFQSGNLATGDFVRMRMRFRFKSERICAPIPISRSCLALAFGQGWQALLVVETGWVMRSPRRIDGIAL